MNAFQSRRRMIALVATLIVLFGAFILLRPRLWVKNKTAKVIVDGRLSEDVKLFHGSDGRLLFYMSDDAKAAYVYDHRYGLWRCDRSYFASAKLIAMSIRSNVSGCAADENGDVMTDGKLDLQSVAFRRRNQQVIVSWQAAPR